MKEQIHMICTIDSKYAGMRLDSVLAQILTNFSRTQIQTWIKNGNLTLNGNQVKANYLVKGNEEVKVEATQVIQTHDQPQPIDCSVIYEDESIVVIDKPAGLVVHPGAGNPDHTLLNALLYRWPATAKLPRAGILHRLDKDTSGLLLVAKTENSYHQLFQALQNREIKRFYQGLVYGHIIAGATINEPIGRHPKHRTQMAVIVSGKSAITHYRVIEKFEHFTHLQIELETGRTHQIRVHMTHMGHPLIGDKTYRARNLFPKGLSQELTHALRQLKRQALHASKLIITHPVSHEVMTFTSSLHEDFKSFLQLLKKDKITSDLNKG